MESYVMGKGTAGPPVPSTLKDQRTSRDLHDHGKVSRTRVFLPIFRLIPFCNGLLGQGHAEWQREGSNSGLRISSATLPAP